MVAERRAPDILIVEGHDPDAELQFELDCQLKLTPQERFRQFLDFQEFWSGRLEASGHALTQAPFVVKRP